MEAGEKVVCMNDSFYMGKQKYKIHDLDLHEVYEVEGVEEGTCKCGGDRIALIGVAEDHCTLGFIQGSLIVKLNRKIQGRLSVEDFKAQHDINSN